MVFPCRKSFNQLICNQRLLLRFQMCIFSASAISWSRKSGCAMLIRASAVCQELRPLRLTAPYSVTTYMVLGRASVTMLPGARVGRMRLARLPSLFLKVEDMQMKVLPPLEP